MHTHPSVDPRAGGSPSAPEPTQFGKGSNALSICWRNPVLKNLLGEQPIFA